MQRALCVLHIVCKRVSILRGSIKKAGPTSNTTVIIAQTICSVVDHPAHHSWLFKIQPRKAVSILPTFPCQLRRNFWQRTSLCPSTPRKVYWQYLFFFFLRPQSHPNALKDSLLRSKRSSDGFRRNCVANYKSAILRLQTQVSLVSS